MISGTEYTFQLFGSVRLNGALLNVGRQKALAVLVWLLVEGEPMRRDVLAALLWPGSQDAPGGLRMALMALRRAGLGVLIRANRHMVRLERHFPISVDVREFQRLVRLVRAMHCPPDNLSPDCVRLMEQATALYTGDFLADLTVRDAPDFDHWVARWRFEMQHSITDILWLLAEHYKRTQQLGAALEAAQRLVEINPQLEAGHRLLMALYNLNDNPGKALNQYWLLRAQLRKKFGIAPDMETVALYNHIRAGMPNPTWSRTTVAQSASSTLPSPLRLLPGRVNDVTAISKLLIESRDAGRTPRLIVITGELGIGKSALLRALAHQPEVRATYQDGVLWASLGPQPDLMRTIRRWMNAVQLMELGNSRRPDDLARQFLANISGRRFLMILDDTWDVDDVRTFLSGPLSSTLIITTRLPLLLRGLSSENVVTHSMRPLRAEDGEALLAELLPPRALRAHKAELRALVQHYEVLPLAIQVLTEAWKSATWPAAPAFFASWRDHAALLRLPLPEREPGHRTVRDTVTRLLNHAPLEARAALTSLATQPVRSTVSRQQAAAVWSVESPDDRLAELTDYGLLRCAGEDTWQIPALIHAAVRQSV